MAYLIDLTIDQQITKYKHKLEVARITLFADRQVDNELLSELESYIQELQSVAEAGEITAIHRLKKSKQDLKVYRRYFARLLERQEQKVARHVKELRRSELVKRKDELTKELEQCVNEMGILENEILALGR